MTDDLKLSLEASHDMLQDKTKTMEANMQKQKEWEEINLGDLWYDQYNPREMLRDLQDRLRRDNIRVDGLEEIDREYCK